MVAESELVVSVARSYKTVSKEYESLDVIHVPSGAYYIELWSRIHPIMPNVQLFHGNAGYFLIKTGTKPRNSSHIFCRWYVDPVKVSLPYKELYLIDACNLQKDTNHTMIYWLIARDL